MKKQSKKVVDKKPNPEQGILDALVKIFTPCNVQPGRGLSAGYDFTVEVLNPLSNSDRRLVSGKKLRISVHTSIKGETVVVQTAMFEKWQKARLPIMLVTKVDSKFYYLWFNDKFYNWLRTKYGAKWVGMKEIRLPLDQFRELTQSEVALIEEYLTGNSSTSTGNKTLAKNAFFDFRTSLKNEIADILAYLTNKNLIEERQPFDALLDRTLNSIYTIAIVGPSRSGKSTTINALMKQEISPVNILPTTGVPFTIQSGNPPRAEVMLHDGTIVNGDPTVKFLQKYVDQQYNRGNKEKVKLVTVYLVNDLLEKGLAYCDVPGLDDVNEETRRISKIAVLSSNAIIYLIDVSPFNYGGFSINSHHLNDLRELAPRMERVYLVFNKADTISSEGLKQLKGYINSVLEQNGLNQILPHPPIYISAKASFENLTKNIKKKHPLDIQNLEDILWDNLLKTNRNGLQTLGGLTYEFKEALLRLSKILRSRLTEAEVAQKLKSDIHRVQKQLGKLSQVGEDSRIEMLLWLEQYLNSSANERLENLRDQLTSISDNAPLPNSFAIRQYLENQAYSILTEVYDEVNYKLDNLYNELNHWIKTELLQVEFLADPSFDQMRDKSNINDVIRPIRDSFAQSIPKALNLLEEIFSSIGDLFTGLYDFFERLFLGRDGVRNKQINQIMSRAEKSYSKVFDQTYSDFNRHINEQCRDMIKQLRDRTNVYFGQITKELNTYKTPPDQVMSKAINECIEEINRRTNKIDRIANALKEYSEAK